jgi:hypothetical protein
MRRLAPTAARRAAASAAAAPVQRSSSSTTITPLGLLRRPLLQQQQQQQRRQRLGLVRGSMRALSSEDGKRTEAEPQVSQAGRQWILCIRTCMYIGDAPKGISMDDRPNRSSLLGLN